MLLDDHKKAVEYFVENILAGTISVDLMKLAKLLGYEHLDTKSVESMDSVINIFLNWVELRASKTQSKEFTDLTNQLFVVLVRSRLLGVVSGVFKEISELEHDLVECKSDNIELSRTLKEQGRIIATYEAGMHQQK